MARIHRYVFDGRLTSTEGDRVFEELRAFVAAIRVETAQLNAWEVAKRFNQRTTYDSEFYALAELMGAEFWTADDRFLNAMGAQRPAWVKRLTDLQPTGT